ncbi:MAG TPA: hypothetical protein VF147_03380 [Vicinamibacterales bacterium]
MRQVLAIAVLAAAIVRPAAAAATFDDQVRAAMAPYYASLLTSARNDGEGTLRHIVALRARWSNVQQVTDRPAWAKDVVDVVTTRIEAARTRTLARDVVGAHAQLESIRAMLRDARARAGLRTFDDAVTDFHEAMERLTGRAGLHNEIALNADDYAAIEAHVAKAAAAWAEMQATAGSAHATAAWPKIADATARDFSKLRAATTAKDMDATQVAAEELKARYFDLPAVLARS